MATNVFVSFDHDDAAQVGGFKGLVKNDNHPLEFNDHSLAEPVKNKEGKPIKFPPSHPSAEPVRKEIRRRFDVCSRLVVLIGDSTHNSEWVEWEIKEFFKMKQPFSGDKTWKRIRGMRLKDKKDATSPSALVDRATQTIDWDPAALDKWLDSALD
jgi:hypothetical protein